MAQFQVCAAAIVALCLLALIQDGEALRCWVCSSDLDRTCGDPFNASLTQPTLWGGVSPQHTLQDCSIITNPAAYLQRSRAVCKKTVTLVSGKETISRQCAWQTQDAYVGTCPHQSVANYIKVEFCETCDTDGCNSAPGLISISPIAQLVALIPAILAAKWALF